jgi:hypothetical protein
MDYDIDSLGSRNFEHLTQSLAVKVIGPRVGVFGDGPDGGREAMWTGDAVSLGAAANWNGYGVLQAKFMTDTKGVGANLTWLKATLKEELAEWARPESRRTVKPDFILFATNVKLSSVPGSGKDAIKTYVDEEIKRLNLPIRDFRVWNYHDLLTQLDDASGIRKRYAAFLTPGDLIAQLMEQHEDDNARFLQALSVYTAKAFLDESLLNLTQAGTTSDNRMTIADVFVDLPAVIAEEAVIQGGAGDSAVTASPGHDLPEAWILDAPPSDITGVASYLVSAFNDIAGNKPANGPSRHRTVMVGGPGQGKSTITQWLAQVYRSEFLRGSPVAATGEIETLISRIDHRSGELQLPTPDARRWPFRVILTELADHLASFPASSLLHYIAVKMSDKASIKVSAPSLSKWLGMYPWLLLIDGLDEVPNSSNREQVMVAITNFFLEVAAAGGDVATIATTRPQGYGEEFSPREFHHLNLCALTKPQALVYGEALVKFRSGAGTTAAEKVMERLRRASREDPTARLFDSPLQITILTVLLEKLGKAPGDRSRLFSAYYEVISQREQEKSGELSDLLQRYEADVDYLHREIGHRLQVRSSEVGETSAWISTAEFDRLITDRFESLGHEPDEVQFLRREFSQLVTDRLVFLARLTSDRIGFELRSLQEFMAGEYIVHFPESQILPEIRAIARSPFWRNVTLFAVGSIFAHREHLRAEVVLLCDELNSTDSSSEVVLLGSDLALDILRDGSCASMPLYARRLAETAVKVMAGPLNHRVTALLALKDADLSVILRREAESTQVSSKSAWMNRAVVLAALGNEATESLTNLANAVDADTARELIVFAWNAGNLPIASAFGPRLENVHPSEILSATHLPVGMRSSGPYGREDDHSPDWFKYLRELDVRGSLGRTRRATQDEMLPTHLRATYTPLGANSDAWRWLASQRSNGAGWATAADLAEFAIYPSAETLAAALDALKLDNKFEALPEAVPWVLRACIRAAQEVSEASSDKGLAYVAELSKLASLARDGQLGNAETWETAEARWGDEMNIDRVALEKITPPEGRRLPGLPIWPELSEEGLCLLGYDYSFFEISDQAGIDQTVDLISGAMEASARHRSAPVGLMLEGLSSFLGSMIASQSTRREDGESFVLPDSFSERLSVWLLGLADPGSTTAWVSWLGLRTPADLVRFDVEQLSALGCGVNLIGKLDKDFGTAFLDLARVSDRPCSLYRLALNCYPALIERLTRGDLDRITNTWAEDPARNCLLPSLRILRSDCAEIENGSRDPDFSALGSPRNSTGANLIQRALRQRSSEFAICVAARGAVVLADKDAPLSGLFLDIAWGRATLDAEAIDQSR